MKKVILIATGVALIGLSSCKKDYSCDCTITSNSNDGAGTTTSTSTQSNFTINASKKDAQEWCDAYDATGSTTTIGSSTYTTDYSCTLK